MLIAGGGYADVPLIRAAQRLGFFVITTGNRPQDLGHRYSDAYYEEDFSSPEAMLDLAQRQDVSAVCACCNDFSAISCAYVAERLGLPGHDSVETARTIHHKDLFREFSRQHAMPVPAAYGARSVEEATDRLDTLRFPIIVKPVDLTGGKGISVIHRPEQAIDQIRRAFDISRAKRVVVEEFVTGTRHGYSAFLVGGKIRFQFFDNEHYFLNPYMVSAASTPGLVPESALEVLRHASERYAELLSLKDGIFHVQFILHDGMPVIIEICRRAPGDLYVSLVQHATGIDYPSWIVRASAGMDCSEIEPREITGFWTRHCVMPSELGYLKDIEVDASVRDKIVEEHAFWTVGQKISDLMTTKFGIVFLRFDDSSEMMNQTEKMQELIRPVIVSASENQE